MGKQAYLVGFIGQMQKRGARFDQVRRLSKRLPQWIVNVGPTTAATMRHPDSIAGLVNAVINPRTRTPDLVKALARRARTLRHEPSATSRQILLDKLVNKDFKLLWKGIERSDIARAIADLGTPIP
jgi:hypothetical protein